MKCPHGKYKNTTVSRFPPPRLSSCSSPRIFHSALVLDTGNRGMFFLRRECGCPRRRKCRHRFVHVQRRCNYEHDDKNVCQTSALNYTIVSQIFCRQLKLSNSTGYTGMPGVQACESNPQISRDDCAKVSPELPLAPHIRILTSPSCAPILLIRRLSFVLSICSSSQSCFHLFSFPVQPLLARFLTT